MSSSPPGPAASTTEPPPRPGPRRASQVRTAADVRSLARNRLIESRLTPNAISMTGFGLNVAAAVLVTQRLFFLAGIAFVVGSVMDTLDGRYSRMSGKGTAFGAFLDSTLDRVEEGIVLAAVAAYFSARGDDLAVAAVVVTVLGSLMVSYTRARAESLIGTCKVGFMERPERIVLVIIGALFNRWGTMAPCLWVIAVLSTITVIHRIRYTYQQTKAADAGARVNVNADTAMTAR